MRRSARWLVFAWLGLIASGALTTGVLRAPMPAAWIAPMTYRLHVIAGATIGVLTIVAIAKLRSWRVATWIGAALAVGALATGWASSRSFSPIAGAAHALSAALVAVVVWIAGVEPKRCQRPARAFAVRPTWIRAMARVGCLFIVVQSGAGALVRHQQLDLMWHLFAGGAAVLALLTPSVAMLQAADLTTGERRAARAAITAVVLQVALGVAVWIVMLTGSRAVAVWLAATVAHVTVGTLTLMAAARLAAVTSVGPRASQQ